jgi:hypothetical protein
MSSDLTPTGPAATSAPAASAPKIGFVSLGCPKHAEYMHAQA